MSGSLRRFLLLTVGLLVLAVGAGVAGYVTKADSKPNFEPLESAAESTGTRGVLQSIDGDTLTILTDAGSQVFTFTSQTVVERLRPSNASRISVGDWLNAGAIAHDQTIFTIVGLTVIPASLLQE